MDLIYSLISVPILTAAPLISQQLFGPIVQRLGYKYSTKDDADTTQLRTLAIEQAAGGKDPLYVPLCDKND